MNWRNDPEGTETKYLLDYTDLARAPGKRVLEVGCGDGRLTWRYARSARRVVGIDLYEEDLQVAVIDRPADLAERVQLARADALQLPFGRQSFDLAIFAWSF
jgi:ubiquinone/menaquinone biosynthesis C-methylase UbiE